MTDADMHNSNGFLDVTAASRILDRDEGWQLRQGMDIKIASNMLGHFVGRVQSEQTNLRRLNVKWRIFDLRCVSSSRRVYRLLSKCRTCCSPSQLAINATSVISSSISDAIEIRIVGCALSGERVYYGIYGINCVHQDLSFMQIEFGAQHGCVCDLTPPSCSAAALCRRASCGARRLALGLGKRCGGPDGFQASAAPRDSGVIVVAGGHMAVELSRRKCACLGDEATLTFTSRCRCIEQSKPRHDAIKRGEPLSVLA